MPDATTVRRPTRASPPPRGKPLPISVPLVTLREELASGSMRRLAELELRGRAVELLAGADALWAIVRRPGRGGIALRASHAPGGCRGTSCAQRETGADITFESAIGRHRVTIAIVEHELPILRVSSELTPTAPLLLPPLPRDVYPLDAHDDPAGAQGIVEAGQRGMNTGLCYFRLTEPAFGSALYVQNLTSLNRYFQATGTKPDGAVGGEWPELGYRIPTPPERGTPPAGPLPAGETITLSDAFLVIHDDSEPDEMEMARRYISMLAAVYRCLDLPPPQFRDWTARAQASLRDLAEAPEATVRHYGFRYIHPYTGAEYPDAMVQLSVLASLRDYEAWKQEPIPLVGELARGLRKFYDPRIGSMRRYLPNVGKDKDKDAVDSWYLYHPLMNLGRLAIDGDRRARRLFEQSLDFAIRAARHFRYAWPIQYKVTDFSVIQAARDDEGLGQTDVGGIYAYVMLQAFELTADSRYLEEARRAIDAALGMRFELNYQANLTAWGAAACLRLWRITNDDAYLRQSYVFVASFFQNVAMWESDIGFAKHYTTFLGATALHDAPYMAMYECFDSFAAFERCLKDSGPDLDPAARMLLSQYCRYALDRAWYYYPDALPEEAIATEVRESNGHIDRTLSFPVEDLYVDGQPAGQVGQEIYGAGAAFVFASRTFHTVRGAPFRIFCDHFLLASERTAERAVSFQLGGGEGCLADLSLIRRKRCRMPDFTVSVLSGEEIAPWYRDSERLAYRVPADGRITLLW